MSFTRTLHEHALETSFEEALKQPEWGPAIVETKERLSSGWYQPEWLVDAIFQNARGGVTITDAYGFLLVWMHIWSGEVGVRALRLPTGPYRDAKVAENAACLINLPSPFTAIVDPTKGRGEGNDGALIWIDNVTLGRLFMTDPCESTHEKWCCGPDQIALEIGTTAVSRTLLHLRMGRGVARWAYDSERVVVLKSHPTMQRGSLA